MGKSVLQGAKAYSKELVTRPYIDSKFAILGNNDKIDYSVKGDEFMVRRVESGAPGLFQDELGWNALANGYGGEDTVVWDSYKPTHEMAKTITVDYKDEISSYTDGAPSSFIALIRDFVKCGIAPVYDQAAVCDIFAEILDENKLTTATKPIDKANIFNTLLDFQALLGEETEETLFAFISNEVMANIKKALIENPSGVAALYKTVNLDLNVENLDDDAIDTDEVKGLDIEIIKFDKICLFHVPTKRMNSEAVFYDSVSEGQEAGGYVAAKGAKKVHMIIAPEASLFTGIKFVVSQLWLPGHVNGERVTTEQMEEIQNSIFGQIYFEQVGINPLKNAWRADLRALYGGGIIKGREKTVYAVTE